MLAFNSHPAVAKYASLVIDAETGRVIHEVNADTRNYPASLTKMMTLYLVLEHLKTIHGPWKLNCSSLIVRRGNLLQN